VKKVLINESPRDAMQGIEKFIPTRVKALYINEILMVGFNIVDFGSFVSPKIIPQMSDTAEVLELLDLGSTSSRLSVVVGNKRGAEEAAQYEKISQLGFPFSDSETFLKLNLNANLVKAYETVDEIHEICLKSGKVLSIYYSMAFGNPYKDHWSMDLLNENLQMLSTKGIKNITLSDTVGIADEERIGKVFRMAVSNFPEIRFGFHLHTKLDHWYEKIDAAWNNGCSSFDGVINGLGGCPMAGPGLVGNLDTSLIVKYFKEKDVTSNLHTDNFHKLVEKLPLF
jgi:hydroxymethylglutaryl-CoA lyase